MIGWALWALMAWAAPPQDWEQVPLEPEPAAADGRGEDDEIIVWGTAATSAARRAVLARFAEAGWTVRKRTEDGSVVLKGPAGWMGSARLGPYGVVTFRRRFVSFSPVREVEGPPTTGMEQFEAQRRMDSGVSTQGGLQGPASKRKIDGVRSRLLVEVEPSLRQYRKVLAETALQQTLAVLPDRLDALWTAGQPLRAGPMLATPAERRSAVLTYWAERPQTREGRLTAAVVEDWIVEVMQAGPDAASPAELDAAAAQRGDGRHPTGR